jgi:hypothetical protein
MEGLHLAFVHYVLWITIKSNQQVCDTPILHRAIASATSQTFSAFCFAPFILEVYWKYLALLQKAGIDRSRSEQYSSPYALSTPHPGTIDSTVALPWKFPRSMESIRCPDSLSICLPEAPLAFLFSGEHVRRLTEA